MSNVLTDPIGDMLTRIRNSYKARHGEVVVPHSKIKPELAKVLVKAKFLKSVEITKKDGFDQLVLDLKYKEGKKPSVTQLVRVSKPSRHLYVKYTKIKPVFSGLGIQIISTSKGLMTGREARKAKMGGEIICKVW
ncbi:30S ribosomal protein S8 [Patescibacteria group bacterium]|nr:30S ribosomal protein S8 [Patescibacteria group bacterium]